MSKVIVCRYGELFLKLGNRSRFEQALEANMRRMLSDLPSAKVQAPHGRLLVRVPDADLEEACARVARVFGLVSYSPADEVASEIDAITTAAVTCATQALERDPRLRRSFRVSARRTDKTFPLTSYQLGAHVGSAINVATNVPVNLSDPALEVGIEVAKGRTFVFAESRPAPGGLPVGTAGRALLLLSGGIDSPVAGWLAAKRGLAMDALYFHSPPFVGEKSKDKVVTLARELVRWQAVGNLYVVSFTDLQKKIRETGRADLAVVLYRRMMMRVADHLADKLKAQALVTGENLGQVASQTLANMATIEAAARRLVLRPLLTYDKSETVALARRIGTFDTSALPFEDCCSLFLPPHPATGARPIDAERSETALDVEAEAAAVAATAERIPLG